MKTKIAIEISPVNEMLITMSCIRVQHTLYDTIHHTQSWGSKAGILAIFMNQQCTSVTVWHSSILSVLPGGGSDLPKFKFSVEFPIGLHVILQLQIKKNSKLPTILSAKLF